MIDCYQSQSLNTCKRVGVSGHIPNLLGTWGLSTIILGKSVSQEKKVEETNSYGLGQQFLVSQVCAWETRREQETKLEVDEAMEGEL
jgi:hypothetical protein